MIAALIKDLSARGVVLSVQGDDLRVRASPGALTAADRQALADHKQALLSALLSASWNQDEANYLLSEARGILSHVEAEHIAGRMTAARRNAARTWLEVAEGYARDRETEAARGWDVMPLLRAVVQRLAECSGTRRNISDAPRNIPPPGKSQTEGVS